MKRLLKKEIKVVPVKVLNMHYCRILERGETMAVKDIPVADAKQILWIEDELRRRLVKQLGRDPYPPDRVEKEHPSNYMVEILKSKQPEIVKPAPEPGIKIKFKVVVKSSLGSKVAGFYVEADSKAQGDLLARKQIRNLGLKRATYKLS